MKQAQNARKQRGRSAQRKGGKGTGGGNRTENKVRGNPKQLLEKYKTQARDAIQAGDRITAEYYLQFADHYQRVLNEMQANREQSAEDGGRRGRGRRGRNRDNSEGAETQEPQTAEGTDSNNGNDQAVSEEATVDPSEAEQPAEVHPELDLSGQEEKPKRAPRKRRAPRAAKESDSPVEQNPEGDEAA